MFMFLNKIGLVWWRNRRGESGHGSEVWNEESRCDFIQAVAVMTPCSPPLLSSFLPFSSCLLPMCSREHIGYFSISGNSLAPPLLSFISTPYQLFLPLPLLLPLVCWARSSYSQLHLMVIDLISLTVYLFAFAVLSAEVLSICPNRQNTGSLFIWIHYLPRESWLSTYLLFQHCTSHSCIYIHTQGDHNCLLLAKEQVNWELKEPCGISSRPLVMFLSNDLMSLVIPALFLFHALHMHNRMHMYAYKHMGP